MPDEPEVAGLLALLLLTEARRATRIRADGSLVVLAQQDRSRWDRAAIDEGQDIVRWCLRRNQPARISCKRRSTPCTRTPRPLRIPTGRKSSPCTTSYSGRAHARGRAEPRRGHRRDDGPAAALALVDRLDLDNYYPFHATRADLLRRLDRPSEAAAAYARAAELAPTEAERRFSQSRWPRSAPVGTRQLPVWTWLLAAGDERESLQVVLPTDGMPLARRVRR